MLFVRLIWYLRNVDIWALIWFETRQLKLILENVDVGMTALSLCLRWFESCAKSILWLSFVFNVSSYNISFVVVVVVCCLRKSKSLPFFKLIPFLNFWFMFFSMKQLILSLMFHYLSNQIYITTPRLGNS